MKVLMSICLSLIAVNFCTAEPSYEVLYHEWYTVPAQKHLFKIIKVDKREGAFSNYYYLVGKAHVSGYAVNVYILQPEEYEVFTSGETPGTAVFWAKDCKNNKIIVGDESSFRPLEFGKKYYLVLDNTSSVLTPKEVCIFLLAFWY